MTKICAGCKLDKPIDQFAIRKRCKDGRYYYCKECDRARAAAWRARRGDVHRAGSTRWRLANPDHVKKMNKEWRAANAEKLKADKSHYYKENADKINSKKKEWYGKPENKEKTRDRNRVWEKNNPEIVKANRRKHNLRWPEKKRADVMERNARKLKATPPWLSDDLRTFMKVTYSMARHMEQVICIKFHVDHIDPLRSKDVCGLHVPWNLRVIPQFDNLSKGNRLLAA